MYPHNRTVNHLDKFTDRRDVDFLHLLFHHRHHNPRHTRNQTYKVGMPGPIAVGVPERGVTKGSDLEVIHLRFQNYVQAEEGEKRGETPRKSPDIGSRLAVFEGGRYDLRRENQETLDHRLRWLARPFRV